MGIRDLTKEELDIFLQLAKTNIAQPINPELQYAIKGKTIITILNQLANIHSIVSSYKDYYSTDPPWCDTIFNVEAFVRDLKMILEK